MHAERYGIQETPACLDGDPVVLEAWTEADRTIVYGLASDGDDVRAVFETDTPSHVQEAPVGDGVAFLVVVDVPKATGLIEVAGVGEARFEGGVSAVAVPVETADDVLLAFAHRSSIWVLTTDGRRVRVTDGAWPNDESGAHASPDGRTVRYWRESFEGVFPTAMSVDVTTGEVRRAGTWAALPSPDGRQVAGITPIDDTGSDTEVIVADAVTHAQVAAVALGVQSEVGDGEVLGWDTAGEHLLVRTGCCPWFDDSPPPTYRFWWVDVAAGTARQVRYDGDPEALVVADRGLGAVRSVGDAVERGVVEVDGDELRFAGEPFETETAEATLGPPTVLESLADGTWLVGDGRNVFRLDDAGRLTFVARGIRDFSAP